MNWLFRPSVLVPAWVALTLGALVLLLGPTWKGLPANRAAPLPVPAGDQPWVFDAAGKKKSMRFGLRMMNALLQWELRRDPVDARFGCLYSTNGWVDSYKPDAPGQEWPELKQLMKIPPRGNVGGVDTWHAFGMSWASTNKANCCDSQFAAIFAASRDGVLRVKRDDGVEEIDVVADTPVDDGLQQGNVSKGAAFAQTWINGGLCQLETKKGKRLYELPAVPQTAAMTYLGVGEGVTAWGGKNLADVRIGDAGQWNAHSWLVGDIRYKVTLKGASKTAKAFQSDFARSERPVLTWSAGKDAPKLSKEELEWLEQHEPEFEKRIADFLAAKSLTVDGEDHEVEKIEVDAAQEFSANAVSYYAKGEEKHHGTAGGRVYVQAKTTGEKDLTGPWEYSDAETQACLLALGVSRLWVPFASKAGAWGFARWYDHAGAAGPAKKKDDAPKKKDEG